MQTDTRIGTIEVKIKKLDAELGAFKTQMAKLRDGPGKVGDVSVASATKRPTQPWLRCGCASSLPIDLGGEFGAERSRRRSNNGHCAP